MFGEHHVSNLDFQQSSEGEGSRLNSNGIKAGVWLWNGYVIWSPLRNTDMNEIQRLISMNIFRGEVVGEV